VDKRGPGPSGGLSWTVNADRPALLSPIHRLFTSGQWPVPPRMRVHPGSSSCSACGRIRGLRVKSSFVLQSRPPTPHSRHAIRSPKCKGETWRVTCITAAETPVTPGLHTCRKYLPSVHSRAWSAVMTAVPADPVNLMGAGAAVKACLGFRV
jgi:hypothetical protein